MTLQCFHSACQKGKFGVSANNYVSLFSSIKYGVPQGLGFGPVLFSSLPASPFTLQRQRLQLNANKTEVLFIEPQQMVRKICHLLAP